MNPSQQILQLVVVRFLCRRNNDLTWTVSPKAAPWLSNQGVAVSNSLLVAVTDEMRSMRDLRQHEVLIHSRHEYFAEAMRKLVEQLPNEVERFTAILRPDEYRILLVYAGQEVYDFFVRDHRFGPPPRGKAYRSNVRGAWNRPSTPRPDVSVLALRRKIGYAKGLGADVTELEAELRRREDAVAAGLDPMDGLRRGPPVHHHRATPEEAVAAMRSAVLGARVPDGWTTAREASSEAERSEEISPKPVPVERRAPDEW